MASYEKVKPGDRLACYVTGARKWVAVLQVESNVFEDNDPVWGFDENGDVAFPIRFRTSPVVAVPLEQGLPADESIGVLESLTEDNKSWFFRMGLRELSDGDAEKLVEILSAVSPPPPPPPPPPPKPLPLPPELKELHRELLRKRQVILQGPPGVGKTYLARKYIGWMAGGSPDDARLTTHLSALPEKGQTAEAVANRVELSGLNVLWDIIQFHPSYTYEDFIRGLVALPLPAGITFEARNKVGGWMAAVARVLKSRGSQVSAVLVVDEINRGDISKIFGELIYGLEYRDEPVSSPYTVEGSSEIVIPSNLLLIGTMNTADRSIALVDYALRRRFVFLDVRPDRAVIENHPNFSGASDRKSALWLFDQIAKLFENGNGRQLQVGHSFFLLEEKPSSSSAGQNGLAVRFGYEVYPLLSEYEAEGLLKTNDLDELLKELGLPIDRPRQGEIAQALAERLKAEPWTSP